MNILNKLLLLLSLSMTPAVSVSAQAENTNFDTFQTTVSAQAENNDFDTFQTAEKYIEDFDYLRELDYRLSYCVDNEIDYPGEIYIFYCFPIYYIIEDELFNYMKLYYSNDKYQFYYYYYDIVEGTIILNVDNYIGDETEMPFLALNYMGMWQVIQYDKAEKANSVSIYNSFYNFFTGFFPEYVVAEYHGIFTFIIVSFLLLLVFGFVFFLFRVIRRLVGFK